MATDKVTPLVLAGGAGTRLWPLSRAKMPKQFLSLLGGRSTYQQALQRVSDKALFASPVVMTNADFQSVALRQAKELGLDVTVVLEPARRDSCAAIASGAMVAAAEDPRTLVLALAADHLIADDRPFIQAVRSAREAALADRIAVFGLVPSEPKTSMGYIRPGAKLCEGAHAVAEFVEKPDGATAARFISEGMLWNGGNFLFRADVLLGEVERFQPAIHAAISAAASKAQRSNGLVRLDGPSFEAASALSIDYAIMERTDKAAVVRSLYSFTDIGSWDAVLDASSTDPDGNSLIGPTQVIDTKRSYVRSEGSLTAVAGLEDVVVVTTPDAVLVASRRATQHIKSLVAKVEAAEKRLVTEHVRSHRPWGWYQEIDRGDRFRVKRIVVEPGGKLSLQKHHHRSEHWVVVRGTAEVTIGDRAQRVQENQSVYIEMGEIHRLANPGRIPLELIEVQTGSYLEEDDIVRLEDVYQRV